MNDIPEYNPYLKQKGYLKLGGFLYDYDFLELDPEEEENYAAAAKKYLGLPSRIFFMSIKEDISALCFAYTKDMKDVANLVFLHNVRTRIRLNCRLFKKIREWKLLKLYKSLQETPNVFAFGGTKGI